MTTERQIQQAIEAGERNRDTIELVRNWCAHARIEKFGGVGLIEAQTGLPIGHHSLQCDHARSGGIASWDLRDAALDFYDRNCVDCAVRSPVGFPNLSNLIAERDARRAEASVENARRAEVEAAALEARRQKRRQLKQQLSSISCAIVDDIEEYDLRREKVDRDRLCESARLAPEHFVVPLTDYLFELTEGEPWFSEVGLTLLQNVGVDPARLAGTALKSIRNPTAMRTAARILLDRLSFVDSALLPDALPTIIDLANPTHHPFYSDGAEVAEPELLRRLWVGHRDTVRNAFEVLLASNHVSHRELAARGLIVLSATERSAVEPFARSLVSTYVRAHLLFEDLDEERHGLEYVRDATVRAFEISPDLVDRMLQDFLDGSTGAARERVFQVYSRALRRRHTDEVIPIDSKMHRLAFQRLLWAATIETDDDILRDVQQAFVGRPDELEAIARMEIDGIVGAVLLLDDRLKRIDEEPRPADETFFQILDRQNRRSSFVRLMSDLVDWVSIVSANDSLLIGKVAAMMGAIPDGRDELKGIVLGAAEHLTESVDGLQAILPQLYYGLVGPSFVVRAYAAKALGELRYKARTSIPPLVYEAFGFLLEDQYVVVHKAAVRALSRIRLPENCRDRAAVALLQLVRHYERKDDAHFLVDCVVLLAAETGRFGSDSSSLEKYLVRVLLNADPLYVKSELLGLTRCLKHVPGFSEVILRLLPRVDNQNGGADVIAGFLSEIPASEVFDSRAVYEEVGSSLAPERPWLACYLVEALARAGAWEEARRVAQSGIDRSEDTAWNRARRIFAESVAVAASFEEAVATRRFGEIAELEARWERNAETRREQELDAKQRDSRADFPFSL